MVYTHATVVPRAVHLETWRVESLTDSCPLWHLCELSATATLGCTLPRVFLVFLLSPPNFVPMHLKYATYCVFPSDTSSPYGRRRCICPWAASPLRLASPSSSAPPSSYFVPCVVVRCRVCRPRCRRAVGARDACTSDVWIVAMVSSYSSVSMDFPISSRG